MVFGLPRIQVLENCIQCGLCVKACFVTILAFRNEMLMVIDTEKCLECRACEQICTHNAILVDAF